MKTPMSPFDYEKAYGEAIAGAGKLAQWLAQSNAHFLRLILDLRMTELTPEQRYIIREAHKELTKIQDAFLAEFGDWKNPGQN
jgi:hypothetical protein